MADTAVSAVESALENQRIGSLQIRVVAICTLIQMCDGYDIGSIGWSVPSLTHAWNLPPSAFTLAFAVSNVGILVGALISGPFGDRVGRRPLLLLSLAVFGIASLLTSTVGSIGMLALWRFFTGLGIAGAFAGTVALTGDYTPRHRRALLIMIIFTGAPLGGFVGGELVALLLHLGHGWPVIFVLGGVFPLILLPISWLWLPESPRFLSGKANLSSRELAFLARLDIAPGAGSGNVDIAAGNPVAMLFRDGYALQTILMWIIFFCSLLNLFLFVFWMPEVLHLIGMTPAQAVFASSMREFGAIFAVLYLGWAIDRWGPQRALALNYAAGAIFIALIAVIALPYALLLSTIFLSGMTIIGSQTGANAACGKLYPARMRASGIGWALGIGRLGGIVAPVLGGYLLKSGWPPTHIFLFACVFAVVAAAATACLRRATAGRVELLAMNEAVP